MSYTETRQTIGYIPLGTCERGNVHLSEITVQSSSDEPWTTTAMPADTPIGFCPCGLTDRGSK